MKKKIILSGVLFLFFLAFSYSQSITVISPHSGDIWYKGGTYTITWTHTGSMNSKVKIRLYQGSTKILGIEDSTNNDGSYRWTIPEDLPAGTYYIRVRTVDNDVYDDGDTFTIAEPTITVTSPVAGNRWQKGNEYEIKWTKKGGMNSNVKIRLYQGNTRILPIINSTNNDGSYSWTVPSDLPAGTYKIRVKTVDNKVYDDSDNFTIEEETHNENSQNQFNSGNIAMSGTSPLTGPLPDFIISDIYLRKGEVIAELKNIGDANYRGVLFYKGHYALRKIGLPDDFTGIFLKTTGREAKIFPIQKPVPTSYALKVLKLDNSILRKKHYCFNVDVTINPKDGSNYVKEKNYRNNKREDYVSWIGNLIFGKDADGGIVKMAVKLANGVWREFYKNEKVKITWNMVKEINGEIQVPIKIFVRNTGNKSLRNYFFRVKTITNPGYHEFAAHVNMGNFSMRYCDEGWLEGSFAAPKVREKKFKRKYKIILKPRNGDEDKRWNDDNDFVFTFEYDFTRE